MSSRRSPQPHRSRSDREREQERVERARLRAARASDAAAAREQAEPADEDGVFAQRPAQAQLAAHDLQPHTASARPNGRRSPAGRASDDGRHRGSALVVGLCVLALIAIAAALALAVEHIAKRSHPKPPPAPVVVKVLIPEGETRTQIAGRAHAAGLTSSYLAASKRSALLNPAHYGAPPGTPNLEGFLFPATYELYAGDPAGRLVHEQLVAFQENFGAAEARRAHELHITPYQLLIVASIIEREAQLAGDRPKVAAVIYNRLRAGMALGVDATIRYVLNDYTQPLTSAQLALDSPYNTRLHKGLPPTPISNPGLAAIRAAGHPAHVGYLYYVAGADGCGEQVFSTSFAQFEHDAAAYREAVQANGGRVPSCHGKR